MSLFVRSAARIMVGLALCLPQAVQSFPATLFGYRELPQARLGDFPQWLDALERQLNERLEEGDCSERTMNRCHLREWRAFLDGIRGLPVRKQLEAVNRYANTRDYVLDLENYGLEDYWAVPREFLASGGDCEDYAITKLFSLRWLGYEPADLRLVIVQDLNLRVPHAVLAVASGGEVYILDNQVQPVLRQQDVVHYAPVFSINEQHWWLHLPPARS